MFTEINEAMEWVMSRRGHAHDPEGMKSILAEAGNPQKYFDCIHVAGTNGKGSFVNYLSDMLKASGKKTGMFTSPHMVNHRDRIRIDGEWIPEDTFLRYVNEYYDLIVRENMTMFETDVLIALSWYRDEKIDIAVIECGLGGRYDSTNVLERTILSVITTIGFDHMDRLGDTLGKIAWHKAGIIPENGKVLVGNVPEEAFSVIENEAAGKHAQLLRLPGYRDGGMRRLIYGGEIYELCTDAVYQTENAALALRAAEEIGLDIHSETVRKALYASRWTGRFETVSYAPRIILDGAHNPHGVSALIRSMQHLSHPLICVFSALRDKQGKEMAGMLEEACDELIVTEFEMYRADHAEDLSGGRGTVIADWHEAIETAKERAGRTGTVVITGSLYFVSTVRGSLAAGAE